MNVSGFSMVSIINSKDIFNPVVNEANLNLDNFSTFIASAGYVFMGKNSSLKRDNLAKFRSEVSFLLPVLLVDVKCNCKCMQI